MKRFCVLLLVCLAAACGQQATTVNFATLQKAALKPGIVLQPMCYNGKFLSALKDSIEKYYPVSVTLSYSINLPANAWYPARKRYKADAILGFLQSIKPAQARCVVGITDKDISTKKGNNADYGVMGLGLQPGKVCVVSTYRLQKNYPPDKLLFQRLLKTVVHEIGHNFGLPHCPNKHCIMADAEGSLNQDKETGLCIVCKRNWRCNVG